MPGWFLAEFRQALPDLSRVGAIVKLLEKAKGVLQRRSRLVLVAGELLRPGQPLQRCRLAVPVADGPVDRKGLVQRADGPVHPAQPEVGLTKVAERVGLGHPVAQFAEDGQCRLQVVDGLAETAELPGSAADDAQRDSFAIAFLGAALD